MTTSENLVDTAGAPAARAWMLLIARVLLAPLFLYSGTSKVLAFGYMASRLPGGAEGLGALLTAGSIAVELGCGLALLLGVFVRPAAAILIAFTIAATLMFHNFWAVPEAQVTAQTINFLKNLGLIGLMGLIASFGAGPWSLQAALSRMMTDEPSRAIR